LASAAEPFFVCYRTARRNQQLSRCFQTMLSLVHATIGVVSDDRPHPDEVGAGIRPAQSAAPPVLKVVTARPQPSADRPFAQADEETLVAQALAGRRWAQRELWYRFAPMVYGLLRRSLGARHDPDDLVQEVFLRVFRRLHTLEKVSALRSFVYSVGVRVVCEEIRHFQVRQRAHAELVLMGPTGGAGAVDYEARDTLQRIEKILGGMKEKHRAVFVLRHVEGMDLREIADGLGMSLATVKRYLVKALRAIEHGMAKDEGLRTRLGRPAAPPMGEGP
jgi:RNA polymerase sigma-70 factor (ECF subfamily)